MIEEASLIPFFTKLRAPEKHAAAVDLASGAGGTLLKFVLGLPASRTGAFVPLAYCEECAAHDSAKEGFAYWRLDHQVPGAFVCTEHRRPLLKAPSLHPWRRLYVAALPGDGQLPMTMAVNAAKEPVLERLASLARIADKIRTSPLPSAFDAVVLRHAYRQGLRDRGLLTRTGTVRIQLYLNAVSAHYASVKHVDLLAPYFDGSWLRGFLRPLRSVSADLSPLMHALVIDFLWGGWEGFCEAYRWQAALTPDADEPQRVLTSSCRVLEPASSTKRDELRAAVLRQIASGDATTRNEARHALGWDFSWLQIYDRDWLNKALPPSAERPHKVVRRARHVDWAARDSELAHRIQRRDGNLVFTRGQPVTPLTVLARLGGSRFAIRWDKLPIARAAVEQVIKEIKERRPC